MMICFKVFRQGSGLGRRKLVSEAPEKDQKARKNGARIWCAPTYGGHHGAGPPSCSRRSRSPALDFSR